MRSVPLERVLDAELNDARIVRALNPPEVRRRQVRDGRVEVRVIQDVEEFRAQLHAVRADPQHAIEAGIRVEVAGPAQRIVFEVAERAGTVSYERRRIEPLEGVEVLDVRVAHQVRPIETDA